MESCCSFEISGEVWRMLLARYKELRHIEAYKYELFAPRKSSRSYMPYSNVDSFLKICKILGLTGIDLFSPSDVVEKKNTRKVCMCIRSLSKKARSRQLNVPDFDKVTCTVAMPTDNVGCIRRRLEQSQRRFLSNANLNSDRVLTADLKKKNSVAASNKKFDTCSEESVDDSDCNSMIQADGSTTTCSYGALSQINSNLIDSPGVSSVVEKYAPTQQFSPSEKYGHHMEFLFSNESSESSCLLLGEDDYQQDGVSSSSHVDSLIHLSGRTSPARTIKHRNETGVTYFSDLDLENDVLEGCTGGSTQERSDLTDQLSISDMIFQETGTSSPIQLDGNDSCSGEYRSPSSHGSNSTPRTIENGFRSKHFDINDVEVSSAVGIKPISDVLELDFDDQLDAPYDIKVVSSPEFLDCRAHLMNNNVSQNMFKYKTLAHHSTSITDKPAIDTEVNNVGSSTKHFLSFSGAHSCSTNNPDYNVSNDERTCMSVESKVENDEGKWSQIESNALKDEHCNQCLELLSGQSYSLLDFHLWDQKGKCAVGMIADDNYGNNSHGTSPQSVSQEGLHVENASCNLAKPMADTLVPDMKSNFSNCDKEVCNATISESDQPAPKSADEECASQHWDRMIQSNTDQNRSRLDTVSENHPLVHQDAACPPDTIESILDEDSCSTTECLEKLGRCSSQVCIDNKNDSCCARDTCDTQNQDNQEHEEVNILQDENPDRTDDLSAATHKPYGRIVLKSVVRGTAVFGALFLFLQLRKTWRDESKREPSKTKEENGVKLSRQKQHKESGVNGVYPASKLGFGV
ncbi:hypothetical protein KPL70_020096 [Citrus sinensis]|nr:hypothetical protein KPL70_020096 [Citrus sinensis]